MLLIRLLSRPVLDTPMLKHYILNKGTINSHLNLGTTENHGDLGFTNPVNERSHISPALYVLANP
jgi:hypothetical protein